MIISEISADLKISHNRKRANQQPSMPLEAGVHITSNFKETVLTKQNEDRSADRDLTSTKAEAPGYSDSLQPVTPRATGGRTPNKRTNKRTPAIAEFLPPPRSLKRPAGAPGPAHALSAYGVLWATSPETAPHGSHLSSECSPEHAAHTRAVPPRATPGTGTRPVASRRPRPTCWRGARSVAAARRLSPGADSEWSTWRAALLPRPTERRLQQPAEAATAPLVAAESAGTSPHLRPAPGPD